MGDLLSIGSDAGNGDVGQDQRGQKADGAEDGLQILACFGTHWGLLSAGYNASGGASWSQLK